MMDMIEKGAKKKVKGWENIRKMRQSVGKRWKGQGNGENMQGQTLKSSPSPPPPVGREPVQTWRNFHPCKMSLWSPVNFRRRPSPPTNITATCGT